MKRGAGQLRLAAAGFDGCCAGEHRPLHRSESASSFTASHSLSPARSLCYCTLRGGSVCVSPRCRLPRQATIALRCAGGRCPGVFPPPAPGLDYDYPNLWDEESGGTRTGTNWHGSSRSVSESWPPWRASGATKRQLSNYGRAAGPVPPSSLRDRPSDRPGRGQKALITRAAGNREGLEQIKTETAPVDSGPGQLAPRRPGWRQGRRWGAQCDGPRHWPAVALPTPEAYRATRVRGSDASLPFGQAISPRLQFRTAPACPAGTTLSSSRGAPKNPQPPPRPPTPSASAGSRNVREPFVQAAASKLFGTARWGGAEGPWAVGGRRRSSTVGRRYKKSDNGRPQFHLLFSPHPHKSSAFCSCISFGTITFAP